MNELPLAAKGPRTGSQDMMDWAWLVGHGLVGLRSGSDADNRAEGVAPLGGVPYSKWHGYNDLAKWLSLNYCIQADYR
jgi:hypothetical protein